MLRWLAKSKYNQRISEEQEFRNTLMLAKQYAAERNADEGAIILDAMIRCVALDVQYGSISNLLYKGNYSSRDIVPFASNFTVTDECGCRVDTLTEYHTRIDLRGDCVFINPWEVSRFQNAILNIYQHLFKFDPLNHLAYYYSLMGVTYVCNGNHSITAGVLHQKGHIWAQVVATEALFPHLRCDAHHIYNVHTGKIVNEVDDFRLNLVFELAKIKNSLEQSKDEGQ